MTRSQTKLGAFCSGEPAGPAQPRRARRALARALRARLQPPASGDPRQAIKSIFFVRINLNEDIQKNQNIKLKDHIVFREVLDQRF